MTYDEIIEQLEITKSKIKEIARNEYGGESWNDDLDAADRSSGHRRRLQQSNSSGIRDESEVRTASNGGQTCSRALYLPALRPREHRIGHTHCHWCGKKLSWDREAYTDRDYPHMSTKGGRRR